MMNNTFSSGVDNCFSLYKKVNHIPIVEIKKYTFDKIQNEFSKIKTDDYEGTIIKIKYSKHFPQISNCVFLNCANSDAANAGYKIDHGITQEGQLFCDRDIFCANFKDLYPFDFKNELLYAKNVTFHNDKDMQFDPTCLRINDVIFAASKHLKYPFQTEQLKPDLERIIDSIFKVAYINKQCTLLLWPIGCGVFKNDQRIIAELFEKVIKGHIGYFIEIVMYIYNSTKGDKKFNDSFISELNKKSLSYRINKKFVFFLLDYRLFKIKVDINCFVNIFVINIMISFRITKYRVVTYPFKIRSSEKTYKKFKNMMHPKLVANIHKYKKDGYYFLPTYHGCGKRNRNGTNKAINYRIGGMCEAGTCKLIS